MNKKVLIFTIILTVISEAFASVKEDIIQIHNLCYKLLDSNLDSAIILANHAEFLAEKEGDEYLEAQSLYIKAYAFRTKEDQGKSFISYLKALNILTNLSSEEITNLKLDLLINTSEILINHYAYSEAIKYLDEGIQITERIGNQKTMLLLQYNKGMALRELGDHKQALNIFNKTLSLAYRLNDELRIIRSLNQKGLTLKDIKRYDEAKLTYQKMISFDYREQSPDKYKGIAWHNVAVIFNEEGDLVEAKEAYSKAAIYKSKRNNPSELFITYLDLSETLLKMNQIEDANHYAQLCEHLYIDCSLKPDNYKFFNLMSEIAYRQNKPKLVREYSQKYFDENEKFLTQQREILEVKDRYKMEVLTAGFFTELNADKNISLLEKVLWTIAILFVGILLITRIYTYLRKRSLSIQITQIKEEGTV